MFNSLSQLVIKIAAPGVPDFYQGLELWDFGLVDPDNRRPVDFDLRRAMLEKLVIAERSDRADLVDSLVRDPWDGAIKLYLTRTALQFRRRQRELFAKGNYVALRAHGDRQRHVIAFERRLRNRHVLAVAGRFFLSLGTRMQLPVGEAAWGRTILQLEGDRGCRSYRDIFTGLRIPVFLHEGSMRLHLAEVFSHLPVALLVHDEEVLTRGDYRGTDGD